jgi:hypothetical protein
MARVVHLFLPTRKNIACVLKNNIHFLPNYLSWQKKVTKKALKKVVVQEAGAQKAEVAPHAKNIQPELPQVRAAQKSSRNENS